MQTPVDSEQAKQIANTLRTIADHLQQLAAKKDPVPSWAIALGGSILGFLSAILTEPIRQRLSCAEDRRRLYLALTDVYAVAKNVAGLLKTINKPKLFPEIQGELNESWEELKMQQMEMLTLLRFDLFSYYRDIARDKFYALAEWSMLTHAFEQGQKLTKAPSWEEAASIAAALLEDIDFALCTKDLLAKPFRRAKARAWERVQIRLAELRRRNDNKKN